MKIATKPRPAKPSTPGKRFQFNASIRPELRDAILAEARKAGRTQAGQAEAMLEELFTLRATLAVLRTDLTKLVGDQLDAELRRRGLRPVHTAHGKGYMPAAAFPPGDTSGFVVVKMGESDVQG